MSPPSPSGGDEMTETDSIGHLKNVGRRGIPIDIKPSITPILGTGWTVYWCDAALG